MEDQDQQQQLQDTVLEVTEPAARDRQYLYTHFTAERVIWMAALTLMITFGRILYIGRTNSPRRRTREHQESKEYYKQFLVMFVIPTDFDVKGMSRFESWLIRNINPPFNDDDNQLFSEQQEVRAAILEGRRFRWGSFPLFVFACRQRLLEVRSAVVAGLVVAGWWRFAVLVVVVGFGLWFVKWFKARSFRRRFG